MNNISYSKISYTFFAVLLHFCSYTISAQSPGSVGNNLALWLKADQGVTGTNPISEWADQSTSASNALQIEEAPILLEEQINFNPAVVFDGIDDYLQITNGMLGLSTYDNIFIYTVSKKDVLRRGTILFEQADNGQLGVISSSGINSFIYLGDRHYFTTTEANTVDYQIWTHASSTTNATPSGTNKSIAINGRFLGAGSMNVSSVIGNGSDMYIGGGLNGQPATANNFGGKISEIIMYTGILTPLEQEKIQSYLAIKYGITKNSIDNLNSIGIDEADYFSSDGSIIWDYSLNEIYHHDVTGIGRDDQTALDQRKSKSSNQGAIVTIEKNSSFTNDKDFLIWGNNNQEGNSNDVPSGYSARTNKIWKVAVSGNPGIVNFSVNLAGLGFDLVNSTANDFALLIDDDGSFAPNSIAYNSGASISNGILYIPNINFNDGDLFTIAGPLLAAPGNVPHNLELWLKADGGLSGSSPVNSWLNQTGATANAIQIANAPDLLINQSNFNPALDFDGNDDYLSINGGLLGLRTLNDVFVYSVLKKNELRSGTILYEQASNGQLAVTSSSGVNSIIQLGNRDYFVDTDPDYTDFGIWTHASSTNNSTPSGTNKSIALNGQFLGAGDNSISFVSGNGSDLFIGGGSEGAPATSNSFSGQIAELIIYTGNITSLEQEKIQSYLAIKYGITKNSIDNISTIDIDETDYFASDGNTILWDYSLEPVYNNNIIGIGRDDETVLNQKQSITSDASLTIYLESLAISNSDNSALISNNKSYLLVGDNSGVLQSTESSSEEMPVGVFSRLERAWKVTNTNFVDTYGIRVNWDESGNFDINDIRFLVDDDGDFSDAQIFGTESGLTFTEGSIIIDGISTAHIPINSTRYITIASISSNTPLPIELLNFEVKKNEKNIEINWTTTSEYNNDYFTVERSQDLINWEDVLRVNGTNESKLTSYSGIDYNPLDGLTYYRLKQIDYDGTVSYPAIKSIDFDNQGLADILILPNPSSEEITILSNNIELSQIKISNSLGQDVTNMTKVLERDQQRIVIDITSLTPGLYLIQTRTNINRIYKP